LKKDISKVNKCIKNFIAFIPVVIFIAGEILKFRIDLEGVVRFFFQLILIEN
jgi:hypothetical protein